MKFESPVPFEEFMAWALHDPQHGYYARHITGIGRRGDFTTAPMLSDSPARAIAAWATHALRESHCRDLIEIGPGESTLAAAVMKYLPWHVRIKTRLHLIETSTPLAARQQKLLGKRATWHHHLADALQTCLGNAVIFSNELVDAFPVRRFQKTPNGWLEMAVRFDENHTAHESLLTPAPLPDSTAFLTTHPLGQIIEIHESYQKYLTSWMPSWKSGRMLTIDYGSTTEKIHHRRPHGTLRAYLFQQRLDGPAIYQNPGRQDLTADVNFSDLMQWSTPWVTHQQLLTFNDFLSGNHTHPNPHPNPHPFTDPSGAGDAFMVLDQRR